MPKSVSLVNLNPNAETPICRFQVVEHSRDIPVSRGPNSTVDLTPGNSVLCSSNQHGMGTNTGSNVSQTLASMHQRATDLINRLTERRQHSRKSFHYRQAHHQQHSTNSTSSGLSPYRFESNWSSPVRTTEESYLDSGGSVHGPMDQKHSTRLGNISRSGHIISGSKHYLTDENSRQRLMRRQSESGAWDYQRDSSSFRGRTFSESRRPYSSDRGGSHNYRTIASHNIQACGSPTHMSRWSSMQSGTHGLCRGSSSTNRYTTTVTRQHVKRHRDPVELLVKHAPSTGASKVDLVSIDNRHESSPQLYRHSPSTAYHYSHLETELTNDRERRLREQLQQTRTELHDLKRSRSLTGDQHLLAPSRHKDNVKSTSNQYLNESSWTTHTLKK